MGRFKRHHLRRCNTKVVHTPNGDMTVSVSTPEPTPLAPQTTLLIRKFFLSLKRRNKFGDFINSYKPIIPLLYNTDSYNARYAHNVNRLCVHFKDIDYYHPTMFGETNFRKPLTSLNILHGILLTYRGKISDSLTIGEVLEPYLSDELAKRDKKIYPNEMVFGFLFGTVFAAIAMTVIFVVLCKLFSLTAGVSFLLINCLLLAIMKVVIKTRNF